MDPTKKLTQQLKLFKIFSLISTSLLVASAVFIFTRENENYFEDPEGKKFRITQEMLGELFEFNDVINVSDPELITKWEQLNVNIDSGKTGRKISLEDAVNKKDSFNIWNKKRFNFVKEITPFGFAFGKQRIRKMLSEIDSTNHKLIQLQKQDSLIVGVRAYLSFSNNHRGKKNRHLDLVFVPIMQNGNSYYNLRKKALKAVSGPGDPMLLNTSSPCPNMCNE